MNRLHPPATGEVLGAAAAGTVLATPHTTEAAPTAGHTALPVPHPEEPATSHLGDGQVPDETTRQPLLSSADIISDGIKADGFRPRSEHREESNVTNRLQLPGTDPTNGTKEWGDTLVTPHDAVAVYPFLLTKPAVPDGNLAPNTLSNAPRSAVNAFNRYFGIPDALPNAKWWIGRGRRNSGNKSMISTTGRVGTNSRCPAPALALAAASGHWGISRAASDGTRMLSGWAGGG